MTFYEPTGIMGKQQNTGRTGWLYVLYDAEAELCKIGCTAQPGRKRQRALIAAHGHKLLNLLNVEVDDRYAAENQCHRHFAEQRRNGEWFAVRPDALVEYVHEHIEHTVMDLEPPFNLLKAINDAALRRLPAPRKKRTVITYDKPEFDTINDETVAHINNMTITTT